MAPVDLWPSCRIEDICNFKSNAAKMCEDVWLLFALLTWTQPQPPPIMAQPVANDWRPVESKDRWGDNTPPDTGRRDNNAQVFGERCFYQPQNRDIKNEIMGYHNQQQICSVQLTYPPANCHGLHQFAIKDGSFKNDDFQGKSWISTAMLVDWKATDCKCASSLPFKWSFGGVHHLRVSWNGGAPKSSIF